MKSVRIHSSIAGVLILCLPVLAEPYRLPPDEIVRLIDAPPPPSVAFSPDHQWMLMIGQAAMPSIEHLSRPMLRLAGLRIDPAANGRFLTRFRNSISLRKRNGVENIVVPLPDHARVDRVSWSHDSKSFAFTLVTDGGTQLWVASVSEPAKPRLLTDRLLTVLQSFAWMPDAKSLLCVLVPADRSDAPPAPRTPAGPNVQETTGDTSPTRTYQDLLATPADEALFEYQITGQLALLSPTGNERRLGTPDLIMGAETAPDGDHLLVTLVDRPFSYLFPVWSFPKRYEIWNTTGDLVREIAKIPLEENVPIEGVRLGPRQLTWKSSEPATLMWVEALDGGDPRREATHRDRCMSLPSPFTDEPAEVVRIEDRAWGLSFLHEPSQFITTEYDRDRRWIRVLLHDAEQAATRPRILTDISIRDRYGNPGRIMYVPNPTGHPVALQHGDYIYRVGPGATPEGRLPFLDRQHLESLQTQRLWRCEQGVYESVVAVLATTHDGDRPAFITNHQSPLTPPNYFERCVDDEAPVALTEFPDPTPQIRDIRQQLVTYERADGVPLSATLYLPADYQEGTRLPLFVWAYPMEFNDVQTAGQVATSPWLFTRIRGSSHLALLTQGYAILDDATMPIVGHPETMNDTFIEQLVASAEAAIDKMVDMGFADPDRVAVGGHSYGAFMTANLLAHCDLFQAGVARSGAYNRTLTPFGFQAERRPLWEAKDVYFKISPFMHANKINEPLLLIHGVKDNNSGTFPTQSKRLFQAIKGNGGMARLVMLPEESHGYAARESILHVHAETIEWLNRHLSLGQDADVVRSATSASQSN